MMAMTRALIAVMQVRALVRSPSGRHEGDGIRPRLHLPRYLTPAAGPAEAAVHAVLAESSL